MLLALHLTWSAGGGATGADVSHLLLVSVLLVSVPIYLSKIKHAGEIRWSIVANYKHGKQTADNQTSVSLVVQLHAHSPQLYRTLLLG